MGKKSNIDTIIKCIAKLCIEKNGGKIPFCSDDNKYLIIRPVIDRHIVMTSYCYLPHRNNRKHKSVSYTDSFHEVKECVRLINDDPAEGRSYLEHVNCFFVEADKIYLLPIYDSIEYTFCPGVVMTYGTIDLGANDKLLSSEYRFNYEYPGF